ncbi:50S ribosomal protein L28 [bacterium HR34]|nr:50S ribosomal protein L28 [bacterium HR34]
MARQCELCKKTTRTAVKLKKLRGKYNPTQKKRQKPNLKKIEIDKGIKIRVCMKCAKTLAKNNVKLPS